MQITLLLILSLISTSAYADNTAEAKAKALFKEGAFHYRMAEFHKALEKYKQAYKLHGHPSIIFNLAQCNRQLKQYEKALFYYKLYLSDWRKTNPNPPNLKEVEEHIGDLKELLKKGQGKPSNTHAPRIKRTPAPVSAKPLAPAKPSPPAPAKLSPPAPAKTKPPVAAPPSSAPVALRPKAGRSTFWLASGIATSALALGALGVGVGYTVQHNSAEEGTDEWADSGNIGIVGFVLAGSFAVLSGVSWLMYYRSGRPTEEEKTAHLGALLHLGAAPVQGGVVVGVGFRY